MPNIKSLYQRTSNKCLDNLKLYCDERTDGRNLKLSSPATFSGRGLIINTNRNKAWIGEYNSLEMLYIPF